MSPALDTFCVTCPQLNRARPVCTFIGARIIHRMVDGPLGGIAARVSVCTRCGLCEGRTNAVPGTGPASARAILVGEAPGREEDLQGKPFVGGAGRVLDKELERAGIPRSTVYITNVVKCRPPKNRVPSDEERDACIEYLKEEISVINPRIVCILGATALRSLLGLGGITGIRGTIINQDNTDYLVSLHPAATMYRRDLLPAFRRDMKKLAGMILST
ncbi:uracil-DNA glycosylase [Cenarchaeum symbiosum A]|uniref:Type-4 uracil-DNA glycosylase n=1 Tax=Cenarchaeum symbiosum (strain A) TaxID=414004 RepID=A0RV64_CENSY|nr:uracil-DNA glycosylase [Cenarchaeum symbiosum A]